MNETNGPGAVVPVGRVVRIPTGWMPVTGDVAYHSTRDVDGAIFCPDPSIYTPAVLERGTPILADEARRLDLFWDVLAEEWLAWDGHSWLDTEARAKSAWLRPHAAPSPQPAPADVVTVPREEWEAVNEFADLIVPLRDNLTGISWTGKLVDVFAAYDRWYAVRIRADQAPDADVPHQWRIAEAEARGEAPN